LSLPRRPERSYLGDDTKPSPGKYRLLEDFPIRGCFRHGGGFEGSGCLEERTQTYRAGDIIDVDRFFWDNQTNRWGAKVVVFSQNRSIPMNLLAQVQ
jgi:hypothetical protein